MAASMNRSEEDSDNVIYDLTTDSKGQFLKFSSAFFVSREIIES